MSLFLRGIVLVLMVALPLNALAANSAEEEYRKAKGKYQDLLAAAEKQKFRQNWTRVIDGFLAVAARFPDRSQGAAGLYMAGQASQGLYRVSVRSEDARAAIRYWDDLAGRYPEDRLTDDALLLAGKLLEELNEPAEALRRYRQAEGAKGDMASEGAKRAAHLASLLPRENMPPSADAPSLPSPAVEKPAKEAVDSGGKPVQLTGIRFWSNPGYTRIVLDLSGPARFSSNFLRGDPASGTSPRLYLDLAATVPAAGLSETTAVDDGLLRQVRTGRPDARTVRVVLDLVSFKDYKVFPLEDPMRIVLDVQGEREQLTADLPEIRKAPAGEPDPIGKMLNKTPEERALKTEIPSAGGNVLRRVVVDAGHGGKDPGAIGPSGIREKDVTLAMARILAKRLREEVGCDVVLTRDRDVFIPLEERTAIANRVGADLFLSVHANAAPNRQAYGIETYYLNFSKNDKAAAVAARENGTSLKQVGDLELILFDLMANSKINESSRLAAEIQRAMVDDLGRHYSHVRDLGVRQGPFYVLLGATMPSVLVEAAFISHPREESRLLDPRYLEKSVTAIVRAVRNYADAQRMIATK